MSAQRKPRTALAPPAHAVALGAARGIGADARPSLLQLEGQDFLTTMFEQLRSDDGRAQLRSDGLASTRPNGVLKLFQPIQRRFHVALIDLWCLQAGAPRLDPKRIDSAGLVIRRVVFDSSQREIGREGWMRLGKRLAGWLPAAELGEEDAALADNRVSALAADPDPSRRLAKLATGSVAIDRALAPVFAARPGALLVEDSSPMHAAPPDVCIDAGRTTFFGVIPTVSSETVPDDPAKALDGFGVNDPAFLQHLVQPLRGDAWWLPLAGVALTPQWYPAIAAPGSGQPPGMDSALWSRFVAGDAAVTADPDNRGDENDQPPTSALSRFLLLLKQLDAEFDAFNPADTRVLDLLDRTPLVMPLNPDDTRPASVPAGQFLRAAKTILLDRQAIAGVVMPEYWPAISSQPGGVATLHQQLLAALVRRFSSLQLARGRYDVPDARYRLRAYVRLKPEGGCPARTLWSAYSEPFTIARWFESAGAPATRIELPSLAEAMAMKPNVAFAVPKSLQTLLSGSAKDLADGKGSKPPPDNGLGIGWLCSFSLPSITICAFICLNIFLSLFDLIFGWMAFIKICIPYPKPK